MTPRQEIDTSALGPNMWLIDEMYRRYREDSDSVGPDWKEFFEGFTPALGAPDTAPAAPPPIREKKVPEGAERLRFGAERIAKNMQASVELPTATSVRIIPAQHLEEHRRVIK